MMRRYPLLLPLAMLLWFINDAFIIQDPVFFTRQKEVAADAVKAPFDIYTTNVDYDVDVETWVERGNYGQAHPDLNNRHFPKEGSGQAKIDLYAVHFDQRITGSEARDRIGKLGLRLVAAQELLALGAQHPGAQVKYPIVCLGYETRGMVPFLDISADSHKRLAWILRAKGDYVYLPDTRFLAAKIKQ